MTATRSISPMSIPIANMIIVPTTRISVAVGSRTRIMGQYEIRNACQEEEAKGVQEKPTICGIHSLSIDHFCSRSVVVLSL